VSLFTQVLECHLDAFVIEGLKVAAKLVAATCGAIEKLAYPANRRVRLTFEGGRAPNVDRAIEIEIVDILIGPLHTRGGSRMPELGSYGSVRVAPCKRVEVCRLR